MAKYESAVRACMAEGGESGGDVGGIGQEHARSKRASL